MRPARLIACFLAALVASSAMAQDRFTIGGAGIVSSSPYEGEDTGARFIPILRYQGQNWRIGTDGAAVGLYSSDDLRAEAVLLPRFSALPDDSDDLDGINRDITLDGGLSLNYALSERTDVTARILQEVTGKHDGQEVDLSLSSGLALGAVPLNLSGGMSWKSEGLGSYLFGVEDDEATVDRDAYDVDATLTPYLSVSSGYPLSDAARLVGSVKVEFLPDEITDSPIIEDDTITSGFLGVQLSF